MTISLMCKCNDSNVENVVSFSIQYVRLPKRRLPVKLLNLQFVKIKAIDSASVNRLLSRLGIRHFRRIKNEDTASSAESVPDSLFGFMIAAVVPQILFTLDFDRVIWRIDP